MPCLALPFMVPSEGCPGRMAWVVLIGWNVLFQNSNGKTILAMVCNSFCYKVFRNHSMLTTPPTFGTSRRALDLNWSLPVEIRKIQPYASTVDSIPTSRLHGREVNSLLQWQKLRCLPAWSNLNFSTATVCLNGREPNCRPTWSKVNSLNWLFFKIFKFSGLSLPGMTSFTIQPIFHLGFIMTIMIVISFAHDRKTVTNVCAPKLRAE